MAQVLTEEQVIRLLLSQAENTALLCRVALGEAEFTELPSVFHDFHLRRPERARELVWDSCLETARELEIFGADAHDNRDAN